ncbi:MAG: glycosyltransferase family 4 protein [Acidobacteriota bacterium]
MLTIYGHCDGLSGVSRHASGFAGALARRGVELGWVPLDHRRPPAAEPWTGWLSNGEAAPSDGTALGIGAPDVMPRLRGRRRIGWVVWETTRMPESHVCNLRDLDEVWTPTDWGRQVLVDSGLREVPVRVVPEGVDLEVFQPIPQAGLGDRPFRFLSVGKWERRKGFDLLVKAWAEAFKPDDPVELVLHTYDAKRPDWRLDHALARLDAGDCAPIRWSRPAPLLSLVLLYNRCDVAVSATRGEGWGLPIFEAMACAKPVIAPAFGALGELLDGHIADLIAVETAPAAYGWDADGDPPGEIGDWGEPRIDHLAELLRRAFENPDRGAELGRRGRHAVEQRWTWDRSAEVALSAVSQTQELSKTVLESTGGGA